MGRLGPINFVVRGFRSFASNILTEKLTDKPKSTHKYSFDSNNFKKNFNCNRFFSLKKEILFGKTIYLYEFIHCFFTHDKIMGQKSG